MTKRYGWIPDHPDHRDVPYTYSVGHLPEVVDLAPQMPPPYDQKDLGACTACAIAGALEFLQDKEKLKWRFTPSRLFIYYNERAMEGTVMSDSGAMIRDGIKSVNSQGVCPEDSKAGWNWPYITQMYWKRPWAACYKDALLHKALKYAQVPQTVQGLRACLAEGYPVVFGISVYDSFESDAVARTGEVPYPGKDESLLGGHAILLVGYDDTTKRFKFRNSWGTGWGDGGYGTIPYDYITNQDLASDFWVIKLTQ